MTAARHDYSVELQGYVPDAYEDEYPMADRLHRRDCFHSNCGDPRFPHLVETAAACRRLMELMDAPQTCNMPPCRRARRCRAPKLDCLFRNLPWMQDHAFPVLGSRMTSKGPDECA